MSICDIIINTIDWMFQNTLLALLPSDAIGLPYNDFVDFMSGVSGAVSQSMSGIGVFVPMEIIFVLALTMITAEISLFGFHIILWVVRLIRG